MESRSKPFVEQFDTIMAFLSLEVIALTCFGIGGFTGIKIMQILGLFIALFTVPFVRLNYTREDIRRNAKWLIPLGAFMLLTGFSAFYFKYYLSLFDAVVYCGLEAFGLAGFFMLGFGVRSIKVIKPRHILYAIAGALAIYCLIVGFYSLVRYGPFYAAIYNGKYYYYQGVFFPVYTEGKALVGFELLEASLQYAGFPALILACSGVSLIGRSPKQEKRTFIILACFAAIGLLYLLLIPHRGALIIVGVVYALAAIYFLVRRKLSENGAVIANKVLRVVYFVLIGIAAVLLLVLLLERKLGLVEKLCQAIFHRGLPGMFSSVFDAVDDVIYNGDADIGKVNIVSLLFGYNNPAFNVHFTRFFPINFLWQNGLLAFLLLIFVFFFSVKNSREYLAKGEGDLPYRMGVVAMMLGIFLYACFNADDQPLVHGNRFMPFTSSNYMMALLFLMGLTFMPEKPKEVAHE